MKIAKAASWLVTVVVPMLLAGQAGSLRQPSIPVADPTAPLVRSDAGRQDTRRFREAQAPLRPYRFGDASYLQFREYLQQAGSLAATTSEDAVPETDGLPGGAASEHTHR